MADTKTAILPPYQRWRHPPGCPDVDWCYGNKVCYWHCQAHECDQCDHGRVLVFSCEGVCMCGRCPDVGDCPTCKGTGLIEPHK